MVAVAGDRDDVVKFWDMRRLMEPTLHLQLPQHAQHAQYLMPTVRSLDWDPPAYVCGPPSSLLLCSISLSFFTARFAAHDPTKSAPGCDRLLSLTCVQQPAVACGQLQAPLQLRAFAAFVDHEISQTVAELKPFLCTQETVECLARTPSQNVGKRQHGVTCLTLDPQGNAPLL